MNKVGPSQRKGLASDPVGVLGARPLQKPGFLVAFHLLFPLGHPLPLLLS